MASKPRTSPDDKSRQNSAFRSAGSYFGNIKKEFNDWQKAQNVTGEMSLRGSTYPPSDVAEKGLGREYYQKQANIARAKEDAEFGQFAGAIFKGRRYDSKGKKIK